MKLLPLLIIIHMVTRVSGQVKIHAHNDYEKTVPLYAALAAKVYSLEVDVFLVKGSVLVAHELSQIDPKKTLKKMYLAPISRLNKTKKRADQPTPFILMIDIKKGGKNAIEKISKLIKNKKKYFDPANNPGATKIVISGDRGLISDWNQYPHYLYFDGRPNETYDESALSRVSMISDSYSNYINKTNNELDLTKLGDLIASAAVLKRPVRLWGIPDTPEMWTLLLKKGVDIINTDTPELCRQYFVNHPGNSD